jgi:transposase
VNISQAQAAEQLGVSVPTIRDISRRFGIEPKDVPSNGKAKGLDEKDMKVIRRALRLRKGERVRDRAEPAPAH